VPGQTGAVPTGPTEASPIPPPPAVIYLISPQPWQHIHVSKHHYALLWARLGYTVYFINPPATQNAVQQVAPNLYQVHYVPRQKGLHLLPGLLARPLMRKEIKALNALTGTTPHIVWTFDTSRFFYLDLFGPQAFTCLHIVDFNENHQTAKAASSANFCLATSQPILTRLLPFNPQSHYLHHGWHQAPVPNTLPTLPGSSPTKIMMLGNLDIQYIDWPVVAKMVHKHPQADFYFIGPHGKHPHAHTELVQKLAKQPNTWFTGPVPYEQVPGYLTQATVLLMVYKAQQYPEQLANPHKLMEYLGTGKPIVASHTGAYDQYPGLLYTEKHQPLLPQLLTQVLERAQQGENEYDTRKRITFAQQHTYQKQWERIQAISTKLNGAN